MIRPCDKQSTYQSGVGRWRWSAKYMVHPNRARIVSSTESVGLEQMYSKRCHGILLLLYRNDTAKINRSVTSSEASAFCHHHTYAIHIQKKSREKAQVHGGLCG